MDAAAIVETIKVDGARRIVSCIICVLVPSIFWFAPLPIDPVAKHGLAIALFMVLAWITEVVDHAVTGLIGCFLFWALGVVRFDVAFSGFANDTPWFLFGATLMGVVASKSGLARRLAYYVMLRVGTTYPRILLGLIVTDFLLTLVVPSGIARIVIMAAIALGLVEAFRLQPGSNGARGMFLIITYTAALFDKMIIAGASSITARGLIERIGEVDVQWSQWFVAFLPCHVITVIAAWLLTLWLFPPEKTEFASGQNYLNEELRKLGPFSAMEMKAAVLLGGATLLWMTDFIHHISSAKIGLGIGLAALLPYVGLLRVDDLKKVNSSTGLFCRGRAGDGPGSDRDQRPRSSHQYHVRLDAAADDRQLYVDGRAVLGGVLLSHPTVQRHRNARHLDAAADEFCQDPWPQSPNAWNDLGVRLGRKDLCLSIGGFDRGVFVWIFQSARPTAYRPAAHTDRVHCDSANRSVLLAANRYSLIKVSYVNRQQPVSPR